jgi:hypothetical protein
VTYKRAQEARVFGPGKLFHPCVLQHSGFLQPFVIYKVNEVLQI